jgi:hypothetical protein
MYAFDDGLLCQKALMPKGARTGQKERQDEAHFTTKIDGKTSLCPNYFVV